MLLTSSPEGATDYIDADLRDPQRILREAERTLDFSQPIAVMLFGILHFIRNSEDPYGIIRTLLDAVPAGSYLALCQLAPDIDPEIVAGINQMNQMNAQNPGMYFELRDRGQVTAFFDGLDLVEPGVVPVSQWRPRSPAEAAAVGTLWGGVGKKSA